MRGDADARGGAIIHQNVAASQLASDFQTVWNVDGYHSAAPLWVAAGVDFETVLAAQFDQPGGLPKRLFPDGRPPDFVDDLVTGARRVERGYVRCAVQKSE